MEELERLFEIATRNYIQLGGVVEGDRKRLKEEKELKRWANDFIAFIFHIFYYLFIIETYLYDQGGRYNW